MLQVNIIFPGRACWGLRLCRLLSWHLVCGQPRLLLPDSRGDVPEPLESTDLPLLHRIGQAVWVLDCRLEHLLALGDQPLKEVREGVIRNPEPVDDSRRGVDFVAVSAPHAITEVRIELG